MQLGVTKFVQWGGCGVALSGGGCDQQVSDSLGYVMCAWSWWEQITGRTNIDVKLKLQTTRVPAPNSFDSADYSIFHLQPGVERGAHGLKGGGELMKGVSRRWDEGP